jgi:transposase, IS30 family
MQQLAVAKSSTRRDFGPRAKIPSGAAAKIFHPIFGLPSSKKTMKHLKLGQRYEIGILYSKGYSQTEIGKSIGKNKSTICRELNRNSDLRNRAYKAELAHKKCNERHKIKPKNIRFTEPIKEHVNTWILMDYSPEQIVGRSNEIGVDCVSVETIYQHVWLDKKNGGSLSIHLRKKGKKYSKRGALKGTRGQIPGRVDIDLRPVIVEAKERLGDFEIDLVIGKDHDGALLTANDRATGMLKMAKIDSKEARVVEQKIIEILEDWKPFLQTITSDNGKEFTNHKAIAEALNVLYFFAKPYQSWQRGANENLNGLIRQYFPKKSDFKLIKDEYVQEIENKLNNRPRKRYGFKTPYEVFSQKLKKCA